MAYELIGKYNMSAGAHIPFVYWNDITGGLLSWLLIFGVYGILTISVYLNQKSMSGMGDFFMASTVGGFIATMAAIILRLIPGFVDGYLLTVTILLTVFSFMAMKFTDSGSGI